ncbi:MAG: cytochrome c maturation protein CcmE [Promethearchaeota archaeon]
MSLKKSKIIAVIGIVASIIVIISLVTINTRPYLRVSQVAIKPSKYYNKEIQVIGIVKGFSGGNFNLTENADSITIDINGISPPNDLENGIKVVVSGRFVSSLNLVANQILTQCS